MPIHHSPVFTTRLPDHAGALVGVDAPSCNLINEGVLRHPGSPLPVDKHAHAWGAHDAARSGAGSPGRPRFLVGQSSRINGGRSAAPARIPIETAVKGNAAAQQRRHTVALTLLGRTIPSPLRQNSSRPWLGETVFFRSKPASLKSTCFRFTSRASRSSRSMSASSAIRPVVIVMWTPVRIGQNACLGKPSSGASRRWARRIPTVDLTGGAPELNANFRWLVKHARTLNRHVMQSVRIIVAVAGRSWRISRTA